MSLVVANSVSSREVENPIPPFRPLKTAAFSSVAFSGLFTTEFLILGGVIALNAIPVWGQILTLIIAGLATLYISYKIYDKEQKDYKNNRDVLYLPPSRLPVHLGVNEFANFHNRIKNQLDGSKRVVSLDQTLEELNGFQKRIERLREQALQHS